MLKQLSKFMFSLKVHITSITISPLFLVFFLLLCPEILHRYACLIKSRQEAIHCSSGYCLGVFQHSSPASLGEGLSFLSD